MGSQKYPRKMFQKCFRFFSRTYTPSGVFNVIIDIKSGNVEKILYKNIKKQKYLGDTNYPLATENPTPISNGKPMDFDENP